MAIDLGDLAEPIDVKDDAKGLSVAQQLVVIAHEEFTFNTTPTGETFALPHHGPNVAIWMRGGGSVRQRLASAFHERTGKVATQNALTDSLNLLEASASRDVPVEPALRLARYGDAILYDLGDETGRVVRVSAEGWEVLERSPIPFRRTEATMAAPTPERGGSLDDLKALINIAPEDWSLLKGYLVATMVPDIPHPIATFQGDPGAGKSTASRLVIALLDPSSAPLSAPSESLDNWKTTATASYVVGLDNISRISETMSDAYCRAVTGDAVKARKKYTDADVHIVSFRRVIIMNGIEVGATRSDLADRLLTFRLDRVTEGARLAEGDVWARFNGMRPTLLGALFDELSGAMAREPAVHLESMPRMADFARYLVAVEPEALEVYGRNYSATQKNVVESRPLGMELLNLCRRGFEGTAAQVLDALKGKGTLAERDAFSADARTHLPISPVAMGRSLSMYQEPLVKGFGAMVSKRKVRGEVVWTLSLPATDEDASAEEAK